jgi:hypothetical protein
MLLRQNDLVLRRLNFVNCTWNWNHRWKVHVLSFISAIYWFVIIFDFYIDSISFNYFLLLFNRFFFKILLNHYWQSCRWINFVNIFYRIQKELPQMSLCHCLLTNGFISSILLKKTSMKLHTIFLLVICHIHRWKYQRKKIPIELHTVFLSMICHIHRWKYWRSKAVFFFNFLGALLSYVNSSVISLLTNTLTNHKSLMISFLTMYLCMWAHH